MKHKKTWLQAVLAIAIVGALRACRIFGTMLRGNHGI